MRCVLYFNKFQKKLKGKLISSAKLDPIEIAKTTRTTGQKGQQGEQGLLKKDRDGVHDRRLLLSKLRG